MSERFNRQTISWALYDFANSAFPTTVMAGFFPVFFKDYWSQGSAAVDSTFYLGMSVSAASLIVALSGPLLGSLADEKGAQKSFLFLFTLLGATATLCLSAIGNGQWVQAALFYVIASIGFFLGLVFYDSLLLRITKPSNVDFVSGLGYSLGYLGGGILFLVNVLMVKNPGSFGLSDPATAVKYSFLSVAAWWLIFSVPLFLHLPKSARPSVGKNIDWPGKWQTVASLARIIVADRRLFFFLLAYWCYIDGVDTIITMAVDYGKSIGFQTSDLISALLVVQFAGFPFALISGYIGQRLGPKPVLFVSIGIYLLVNILAVGLSTEPIEFLGFHLNSFLLLALLIALAQGAIQSLSRSLYSTMIPKENASLYYGVYNMIGKFAAIVGPFLVGSVGKLSGSPRVGILSTIVLFISGGLFLAKVKTPSRR